MKSLSLSRTLTLTLGLTVAAVAAEVAGIAVAPTAVYLTNARPGGAVVLYNSSGIPEEVTVETLFGYPTTDGGGQVRMFTEPDSEDPRSAAGWIRVLPQRLVVPPGERRSVRLLAQPPAGLPDGEYWTRLAFTARGQRIPVAGAADTAQLRVGVDLQIRTIISTTFRKGEVTTGVAVEEFLPRVEGDSLILWPNLVRQGNAAFIGLMQLQLVDRAGEVARRWENQVAVYREYHRRFSYDVSDLPPGGYQLQLRLSTEREDIDPQDRLPARPLLLTEEVTIR